MRFAIYVALFCLFGVVPASQAQSQAQAVVIRPDTASYPWGGDSFRLGELVRANGTRMAAYVPSQRMGYEMWFAYFLARPVKGQMPKRYKINIEELRSMTVHGHYYETMRKDNGKPSDVLAYQLVVGSPIELLVFAEQRFIALPIPLGVGLAMPVATIKRSDKNHWYLRRDRVVTALPNYEFSRHMSQYLKDAPGIAQRIFTKDEGYRMEDLPAIVAEYNRLKAVPVAP